MKYIISDNLFSGRIKPNEIPITNRLFEVLGQSTVIDWESLFSGFRLTLQNRIAGSDERDLLKLQAKIEGVNELELFFKNVVSGPNKPVT